MSIDSYSFVIRKEAAAERYFNSLPSGKKITAKQLRDVLRARLSDDDVTTGECVTILINSNRVRLNGCEGFIVE